MGYLMRKKRKNIIKLLASVLLLAAIISSAMPISAAGNSPVRIRVPFPEAEGFTMTDENGNRSGLVVDFLYEIAKYTGWLYEFIDVDANDMTKEFIAGKYDLMGGTYYSEAFEKYFAYPDYSCGNTKAVLLTRQDNDNIKGYDLRDLNGKTIGVVERATDNIRRLEAFLSTNGLSYTLRPYTSEEVAANQINLDLKAGKIDLKLGNATDDTGEYRAVAYFDAQPHYLVAQPDNRELLNQLNWAMERIMLSDPHFPEEVYTRYFNDTSVENLLLIEEEKSYIKQKGTVTVAVPDHFHPLYCIGYEDGDHTGLVPELLKKITARYGIEFSYIIADSYAHTQQLVIEGKADMAGIFFDDAAETMREELVQTKSYAALSDLIVRNRAVTYPADGLTCGLLEGRQLPSYAKASKITYFKTIEEVLSAVNTGRVDFACGLSARVEQMMQDNIYANVVPVTLSANRMNISFAMPMPANPELLSIMNKGINSLSEEDRNSLLDHNLVSIGDAHVSLKNFVETNPILAITVISTFLLLVIIAIIVIANLRVKSANMQKDIVKAEADSRAKSEFLSRMSHEIRTPMNAIVGTTTLMAMEDNIPESIKVNLAKLSSTSQYLLGLINDILEMSRIDNGMLTIAKEDFSLQQQLDELCSMMQTQAQAREITLCCETNFKHSDLKGDAIRLKQVLMNLISNAIKFTSPGGRVYLRVEETTTTDKEAIYLFRVSDSGIGIKAEDLERIFESFEQAGANQIRSQGTGLGLPISRNIVRLMGGTLKVKSKINVGSEFFFSIPLSFGKPIELNTHLEPSFDLKNVRILLAEDNAINAEIAIEILNLKGIRTEHAVDGAEAVKCFEQSAPGYFNLILMDLRMPNMGGLEATRAIRASGHSDAAKIPIVALTANSFQKDRDMAKEAGMNDFLAKPMDIDLLYAVLKKCLLNKNDNSK
ncbi:transporter substrate-binding domain-containing protein [Hungatella sp. L12]|uniref:Stage 0 sporulation protein A homolog n=1 Tax=Hungatella hominis TaxID=2763050 RepID=A0ABR7H756_9FIRM|nr:transporter substrate-binding domain-containing protein [Hungatella hominis]MBC5709024.1 transporter substrate-binding domain-containing protein [Hungatella hominis]